MTCSDSMIDPTRAVDGPLDIPTSYLVTVDELVARQIRDRMPQFQLCYLQRAKYIPALQGRVTARFTVKRSGSATNIRMIGIDAEVDRCVCEKLSTMTFGSFDRDQTVEYAFLFSPPA